MGFLGGGLAGEPGGRIEGGAIVRHARGRRKRPQPPGPAGAARARRGRSRRRSSPHREVTSSACLPFWPCTTLKETFWPSFRLRKPVPEIERKWTNTSSPLSVVMKPKPLASLNHFTVPV